MVTQCWSDQLPILYLFVNTPFLDRNWLVRKCGTTVVVYDDERKIHDVGHMLPYEFQIAAVNTANC